MSLLFQTLTIIADLAIFVFIGYYLLKLRKEEKVVEKQIHTADRNYHEIVDDALSKERKIMEDAIEEADNIILSAKDIKTSTKQIVDDALQKLVKDIEKQSVETASNYLNNYSDSLKELTSVSLVDFKNVAKALEGDLQKQLEDFRRDLLPNLESELEEYKKLRLKQSEEIINKIIEKASQEIFNKSLSSDDHQKILIDSLEKAKIEGIFS
jgi:hypothetical protein